MTAPQFGLVASIIGWTTAILIWINAAYRSHRAGLTEGERAAEDRDAERW
jgi:hypothetical protein